MAQKEVLSLLIEWKQNLKISRATQYETAKQLSSTNGLIGIPAVVLSAIVGTSILATAQESVNTNLKIAAGLISVLAAVLAGIQTLLRLEERAEKHRAVGSRYSALIREIDEVLAFSEKGMGIPIESVKAIREQYDKVSSEAPPTSQKMYKKAIEIIKSQDKRLEELRESESGN